MYIAYNNDISTYLSDWVNQIKIISKVNPQLPIINSIPKTFKAIKNDYYSLSVMIKHLDLRISQLESSTLNQFDSEAYSEGKVFLNASFIFFRILIDDIAGVIRFFYHQNEKKVLPERFSTLLKSQMNNKLPGDLSTVIKATLGWFPRLRCIRDDITHRYGHLNIFFTPKSSTKISDNASIDIERNIVKIRELLGVLLNGYQVLVDDLLDHFDNKFYSWFGFVQSESGRTETIGELDAVFPLYWAIKYGKYKNPTCQLIEDRFIE